MLSNKVLSITAHIFAAIGAINWGFYAFLNNNVVAYLTGLIGMPQLDKIIYGLVALCGVYVLLAAFGLYKCDM